MEKRGAQWWWNTHTLSMGEARVTAGVEGGVREGREARGYGGETDILPLGR